jgi:hypothetical protein
MTLPLTDPITLFDPIIFVYLLPFVSDFWVVKFIDVNEKFPTFMQDFPPEKRLAKAVCSRLKAVERNG